MQSPNWKLALTSVAYVTTLLVVSSIAVAQLSSSAQAEVLQLKTVDRAEIKRSEALATPKLQALTRKEVLSDQRDKLTASELAEVLTLAGFTGRAHKTAWAIAMRESTGRPQAHNGNAGTGDNSYGLFQINMIGSLGTDRRAKFDLSTNDELFNPIRNAEIAYFMSNGGADFGAWGLGPNAYRSGAGESTISKWYDAYPGTGK